MTDDSEFVSFLLDQLASFDGVSARRMFGGHGLFRDGLMFALVADDTLYLKVDAGNRADFEAAGAGPFTYERQGREIALTYYEAPPDVVEAADELGEWSRKAFEAALRTRKPKRRGAKRRDRGVIS